MFHLQGLRDFLISQYPTYNRVYMFGFNIFAQDISITNAMHSAASPRFLDMVEDMVLAWGFEF